MPSSRRRYSVGVVKVKLDGTIEYGGELYVRREKVLAELDTDMAEPPVVRWWQCHGCDSHFVAELGNVPAYCPKCGGMVM